MVGSQNHGLTDRRFDSGIGTYNYYEASSVVMHCQSETTRIVVTERDASFEIVKLLLLAIVVQYLKYLLSHLGLPPQIAIRMVVFEDAFARRSEIDVQIINTWDVSHESHQRYVARADLGKAFEGILFERFQCSPGCKGLRRVQNRMYRLHTSQDIAPHSSMPFEAVFRPGCHVRMSIMFVGSEVTNEACPKCDHIQLTHANVWTTWYV